MKQMTCEMCGGTDLIKQDGVFVCQSCGLKYSVEEAKKMLVEVEGTVNVQNSAQLENLLKLAHSSFDSKNYAKAEDFCNQVIAMDDKNYEAWTLKAEAIGGQTTADNTRIDEIINCIMTAYDSLDDEGKKEKQKTTLFSVKSYYEEEVKYNLNTFESKRPTYNRLTMVTNSYSNAKKKIAEVFDVLGSPEGKEGYLINFANFFIEKVSARVNSTWKTTVGYNYYRDYFGSVGSGTHPDPFEKGGSYVLTNTNMYRPIKKTWDTFLTETDNLIQLLQFAEREFNDKTNPKVMEAIYSNISFFDYCLIDSWSWTITTGFASRWDQYQSAGWHEDYCLTVEAKNIRRKEAEKYAKKAKEVPLEVERKQKARLEKERKEKADKYWSEHKEEKKQLESEKTNLTEKTANQNKKIKELEKELSNIEGKKLDIENEVKDLSSKKIELLKKMNGLGIFQGKEKKRIEGEVTELTRTIEEKTEQAKRERANYNDSVKEKIDELKTEIDSIKKNNNSDKKKLKEVTDRLLNGGE